MFIIGEKDPDCGCYRNGILQAILRATATGLSNCGWQYDDLRDAIAKEPDSPHVFDLSPTGDNVETNRENPINDRVDNFISGVLAALQPHPVFFHPIPSHRVGPKTRADSGIERTAVYLLCVYCAFAVELT